MKTLIITFTLFLLAFSATLMAQQDNHIGTWELRRYVMEGRAGQEMQVHRLILTQDGRYLNSATIGGAIPINYRLERDENNIGSYSFMIESPDDHKFGRGAGLRVDKRGLTMTYFDGRVLTYTRISENAEEKLLAAVPDKKITIEAAENNKQNKAEMATPRKPSD